MEGYLMSIMLQKFRNRCLISETHSTPYDYRGRAIVFGHLIGRFGIERVKRHKRLITQVLNNAEGFCVLP